VTDVSDSPKRGTIERMALPEHWQRSSNERILAWVGTLATLTGAAFWVRNERTRARRLASRDHAQKPSETGADPHQGEPFRR